MVVKLLKYHDIIELEGAGCTAEGALRFKSTSFEERSFGARGFFCLKRSAL